MENHAVAAPSVGRAKIRNAHPFIREMKKNRYMYLLTLPGILFLIVFAYVPLVGLVIAFEDFSFTAGIFGSKFVGLKNFEFLFKSKDLFTITFNTVYLNVLFIVTGTVFSVMIAIMFSELTSKHFSKVTQSFSILPHFISWPVVAMFAVVFLTAKTGIIDKMLIAFGMHSIDFYMNARYWPLIFVLINIWSGAGFGSIIYTATIAGFDQGIYEAAAIDGASRLQCIFRITLPLLKSTIILLTLFSVGKIFFGNFGMIYTIVGDNSMLFPTTDIIDTYVYRALRVLGDMGMSSATGLYQSVVGFIFVVVSNALAKKFDPDAAIY